MTLALMCSQLFLHGGGGNVVNQYRPAIVAAIFLHLNAINGNGCGESALAAKSSRAASPQSAAAAAWRQRSDIKRRNGGICTGGSLPK
jgi:hypothetical protein